MHPSQFDSSWSITQAPLSYRNKNRNNRKLTLSVPCNWILHFDNIPSTSCFTIIEWFWLPRLNRNRYWQTDVQTKAKIPTISVACSGSLPPSLWVSGETCSSVSVDQWLVLLRLRTRAQEDWRTRWAKRVDSQLPFLLQAWAQSAYLIGRYVIALALSHWSRATQVCWCYNPRQLFLSSGALWCWKWYL